MNNYLAKLWEISRKSERLILGLMSGTSLDGLDICLCKASGSGSEISIEVSEFTTVAYTDKLRNRILGVQSKNQINTRELTLLNTELALVYSNYVLEALGKWGIKTEEIDMIASHGQTVYHAPEQEKGGMNATLQIADGDHIAQKTGIITVSDFRQKHTAAGGQGAPLAGIFDEVLFREEAKNRMLLNLGGIANFTWLPSKKSGKSTLTGDIGPANTLINEAMQKYYNKPYDDGGEVAESGTVNTELVRYVLLEPYFRKSFPKTTGQEDFQLEFIENLMEGHGIELSKENLVASLTAITSQSITRAFDEILGENERADCFVSGGGLHNKTLMKDLKKRNQNISFMNFDELGIPSDAKEAAMMGFFANELIAGEGFPIPGVTEEKIHFGKISLPH
ncbi:MAG: anhydro-N-acetylmuramic acid kinase [Balneola sp.]|jgi:anhydro-N-acetylmuramic acid kinase|nr:anhydro-N-acetylmuramic acid kinase [Balneola sp.]MBE78719.1 anhydro-N-acetylmuramic acid kinase [Balneola sp.]HBX67557.1 anhydro-N-acetylmuramic acid kinase [Balneolaceae bacterium]|tara:strand:- start:392 stop:1573 length:1182 start_codon:yes stop_codon:yes gene_type:complete